MKIVYLSKSIIPSRYANSIHVMKMCHALAKEGHDVSLIYPDSPELESTDVSDLFSYYGIEENFDLVKIRSYPRFMKHLGEHLGAKRLSFLAIMFLRKYLYPVQAGLRSARLAPDLIYSRYLPASFWSSRYAPFILETHDPYEELGPINAFFFRCMRRMPQFRRLVVITSPLKEEYRGKFPWSPGTLLVAPDAADPATDKSQTTKYQRFSVGYAGHLYAGRGIEMIADLARRLPEIDFHLIGGHPTEVEQWKSRTAELQNMTFHGFVPPSDVPSHLARMDVLLAPYQRKVLTAVGRNTVDRMSPLKIFEYMSVGVPMVCSDIPVLHDVLQDGVNALLCPPDDVQAWVSKIELLRSDESLRQSIGQHAHRDFTSRYTWSGRARSVLTGI